MPPVAVSRSLSEILGVTYATDLAKDFRDYKAGITSFGVTFGRDKPFGWPSSVVEQGLWHVHLEDESVSSAWDHLTRNYHRNGYTQDNYTSDVILVYGRVWDAYKAPFFLHSILSPKGHKQMDDSERMLALSAEFTLERDAYAKGMPSAEWILVE